MTMEQSWHTRGDVMLSMEQRSMRVGDAILLERAAKAVKRNFPVALATDPVAHASLEWLRVAAILLRREGESGEPAH
jgi:hypothetical protein